MYSNRIIECGHNVSESELKSIEQSLGIKIPKDLVKHYLNFNGGKLEKRNLYDSEELIELQVYRFLYVGEKSEVNLNFENTIKRMVIDRPLIPMGLIPFATNEGGDFFSMNDKGEILFCSMDFSSTFKNTTIISSSISNFINNMYEMDW